MHVPAALLSGARIEHFKVEMPCTRSGPERAHVIDMGHKPRQIPAGRERPGLFAQAGP